MEDIQEQQVNTIPVLKRTVINYYEMYCNVLKSFFCV